MIGNIASNFGKHLTSCLLGIIIGAAASVAGAPSSLRDVVPHYRQIDPYTELDCYIPYMPYRKDNKFVAQCILELEIKIIDSKGAQEWVKRDFVGGAYIEKVLYVNDWPGEWSLTHPRLKIFRSKMIDIDPAFQDAYIEMEDTDGHTLIGRIDGLTFRSTIGDIGVINE